MEKELLKLCQDFIRKHEVHCPEVTVEDRIYENAPELVEAIADIVGYYDHETGDLDRSKYGDPRTPEFGVAARPFQ